MALFPFVHVFFCFSFCILDLHCVFGSVCRMFDKMMWVWGRLPSRLFSYTHAPLPSSISVVTVGSHLAE